MTASRYRTGEPRSSAAMIVVTRPGRPLDALTPGRGASGASTSGAFRCLGLGRVGRQLYARVATAAVARNEKKATVPGR